MERNEAQADDYSDYHGGLTAEGIVMSQVQQAIDALVAAVKDSEEYKEYLRTKELISKYPLLKEQADKILRQNYEMQNRNANLYEEGDRMRQEYREMFDNQIIWDCLNAENALCRILRQVNFSLLEELDFETAFDSN